MNGKQPQTMNSTFPERLRQAAGYARVEYSPTEIGKSLGLAKQTVHRWMMGNSIPSPENIFHVADIWRVSARWLATGEGSMFQPTDPYSLTKSEAELLSAYRSAQPEGKSSLRTLAKALGRGILVLALALILWPPVASEAGVLEGKSVRCYSAVYYVKCWLRRIRHLFKRYDSAKQGIPHGV